MKANSSVLIEDLLQRTHQNLFAAEEFKGLPLEDLNSRPGPGAWSALECFEHLNIYGRFYLPEIEKQIRTSKHSAEDLFSSGLLGNYFAQSMLPRERLNKMKTLKSQNPIGQELFKEVIELFIDHQHQLLILLDQARRVSLTKTKTGISITKYIRLKLGDTFRVLVYHNQRHLVQAQNALPRSAENGINLKQPV